MLKRFKRNKTAIVIVIMLLFAALSVPAFATRYTMRGAGLKDKKSLSSKKPQTTFGKIDAARKSGKISKDYSLLLKAQALLDPGSIPKQYHGKPVKDGTFILRDIRKKLKKVKNRTIKSKINSLVEVKKVKRVNQKGASHVGSVDILPSLANLTNSYSIPTTGKFQIWYTISGADAVKTDDFDNDGNPGNGNGGTNGVPDSVENLSNILENVWAQEITNMGYNEPLGSSPLFQIFLKNIGAYGYTYQVNSNSVDQSDAFIVIENDFVGGFGGTELVNQQVTSAHEFFHAIQYSYNDFDSDYTSDWSPNAWWMEATAVWMEEQVYPAVNDYLNYVYDYDVSTEEQGWFAYPEYSLNTFNDIDYSTGQDGHQYGSVIFIKYIQQKAGGGTAGQTLIKNIWNSLISYNFSTSDNSIAKKIAAVSGWNFNTTYSDFMSQNYIIERAKSSAAVRYALTDAADLKARHDSAWASYPPYIWVHDDTQTFPFSATTPSSDSELPQYLGTNFNVINAPSTTTTAAFTFTGGKDTSYTGGTTSASWSVKLLLRKSDGFFDIFNLVSPEGTSGALVKGSFGTGGTYQKAIFVISVVGPVDNTLSKQFKYTYGARKVSTIGTPVPKNSFFYGSSSSVAFTTTISPIHSYKTDVILQKSSNGSTWTTADSVMSWNNSLLKYISDPQKPSLTTGTYYYRARWVNGDSDHAGSISSTKLIPIVGFLTSKTSVAENTNVTLSGTVYPTSLKGNYVTLQWKKSTSSTWNTKSLLLDSYSKYSTLWKSAYSGTYYFRVLLPGLPITSSFPTRVASYSVTRNITVN